MAFACTEQFVGRTTALRCRERSVAETEDATVKESHIAVDDPVALIQLDESEGILTVSLPEPPEDPPEPDAADPDPTDVERKVLEQANSEAD